MARKDRRIKVCIIDPTDPFGSVFGGVNAFIRQLLSHCPDDIKFSVIGITTEPKKRPGNCWATCTIGEKQTKFLPILRYANVQRQPLIPVSLLFTLKMMAVRPMVSADVLEFHRIETLLAWRSDHRSKTAVIHQNPLSIRDVQSSVRWRYFPAAFDALEARLLPRLDTVYAIREEAVAEYQRKFPQLKEPVRFIPTMVDTNTFKCVSDEIQRSIRLRVRTEMGFNETDRIVISVGRLENEKDPLLLLRAFLVLPELSTLRLVFVGDGKLRIRLEAAIQASGQSERVRITGVLQPNAVARLLAAADAFALSSSYEGRPIAILEALATGLPVASTAVGEIHRMVFEGKNGSISSDRNAPALAAAIVKCLAFDQSIMASRRISDSVNAFSPDTVLAPLYDNYRSLAGRRDR